ncbi:MAG: 16S rRNA (cytidine(1402)-2'-O)-methyltransferase [Candidatus Yanofskybacteria bacterium RIFCSPLOWO2_01_FULL_49_17]|uniref:Ribosomal RNA small subunit methyltransferase I n=1 Tax=Candidatus Yanofskybacteria bacterium RIFCSPLOWO2_01_FULL_49_17 TaxID=1802700 RepID=A0A1F8GRQ5_9BACT|nr:MAG: 16S rRNA (cytidine(1402)-2'-O)-methyltransferase [Candidatus Yanofskybacteria bacterium RIFCSPLOWO2_01_FULL_49_17]
MKLYIVATPIGNLADITLRAVNTLANVELILAEDTRVTRTLLEHLNIRKELMAYHAHSRPKEIEKIINFLRSGKNIALVSDAGTPGVNDPGNYLIGQLLKELPELQVVPIPGPNAAAAALSVSGFPSDRFYFLGFPPHKKGRQTFFKDIGETEGTVVFYESKHRILKCLKELKTVAQIGERPILVCRELTKQFETFYRGTAYDIEMALQKNKNNLLGEFVVVIGPKPKKQSLKA